MEGEAKRHLRTAKLIGYTVKVTFESFSRDYTDSWQDYYESESISRVYRHLFDKYYPHWLETNECNAKLLELFKSEHLMTDSKLEELFKKVYSREAQPPEDEICRKFFIEVEEYRTPHFEMV